MRPSTIASPPVQLIRSSSSGTGSVRTTYEPKFVRLRDAGRQPANAALVASTISGARSAPWGVRISPSRTRSAGVRSCTVTPAAIARRRRTRTSKPGCTVAPSGKKTPRRNTGERTRSDSSPSESGTAFSGCPTAAAASTEATMPPSWAGAADTFSRPPSRSHTSSPRARTAGMIASAARQSRTAASSPSSGSSEASASQYPWRKPPLRPLGPLPQSSASTSVTRRLGSRPRSASAVQSPV